MATDNLLRLKGHFSRISVEHHGPVWSVAAATLADGQTLIISCGGDGTVRRFDATTGEPIGAPIAGPTDRVWSVATATLPDGHTLIVSGGGDGTVRRFDATTGELVGEPISGHVGRVWSVATAILPDGRVLIVSGGATVPYAASTPPPENQ